LKSAQLTKENQEMSNTTLYAPTTKLKKLKTKAKNT
jgi:hypothetical protein